MQIDLGLIPIIVSVISLIFVLYLIRFTGRKDPGTPRMREIAKVIREGAKAYLRRQNLTAFIVAVVIAALLYGTIDWTAHRGIPYTAASYISGTLCSMLAGYVGMRTSTLANVRTTAAAKSTGLKDALKIAFRGGAVTGLSITSLSILGITAIYYIYGQNPDLLIGFGFGASLMALFAQVGGGIYTKSADVGADLAGKIEEGIPEDDPRNPAVIADQVGDNVGDCAGRGADLFESYADNNIGMMILGAGLAEAFAGASKPAYVLFPLIIGAIGLIATIVGVMTVRVRKSIDPMKAINVGLLVTGVIVAVFSGIVVVYLLKDLVIYVNILIGLVATVLISFFIQYYTSENHKPVRDIAESSKGGPALTIITGLSRGLESTVLPVMVIIAAILVSFLVTVNFGQHVSVRGQIKDWNDLIYGFYGIASTALGMLSMTAIVMASDTYGPITDNAAGIAEMSGVKHEVRDVLDSLDSIGNTTKAVTKGFAMGCASLSAFILFSAYLHFVKSLSSQFDWHMFMNLTRPDVIIGLFVGGMIAFAFSALTIRAVASGAFKMVEEVRRQFKAIPGLREGKANPDYTTCVDISTKTAIKKMILPTLLALISPILTGFVLGPDALGAFLLSATVSGVLLAVFMFNAGGQWDNAKKYIESGHLGGKGTPTHAAAVVGDTVGDPLKDTAGPSLHILVKMINIVALTFLPLFIAFNIL